MRLRPAVAGLLLDLVFHSQVTANIAHRDVQQPSSADEDMGVILTHALPRRKRLLGRRAGICCAGQILDLSDDGVGSEERRVGRACGSTGRTGWCPDSQKTKKTLNRI